MKWFEIGHQFFPVGQGLFSTGSLELWNLSGHEAIEAKYGDQLSAAKRTYRWVCTR